MPLPIDPQVDGFRKFPYTNVTDRRVVAPSKTRYIVTTVTMAAPQQEALHREGRLILTL